MADAKLVIVSVLSGVSHAGTLLQRTSARAICSRNSHQIPTSTGTTTVLVVVPV